MQQPRFWLASFLPVDPVELYVGQLPLVVQPQFAYQLEAGRDIAVQREAIEQRRIQAAEFVDTARDRAVGRALPKLRTYGGYCR